MGGKNVPIYLPPIWISLSSEDIHKGDETSPCMPAAIGCTVHNVPGRSTDHGTVSRGDTPSDSQYTCTVPGPGFLINWEKSILSPQQEIVFLGLVESSTTLTLSLPPQKLHDLYREIQSLLNKEVVSVTAND